MTSHWISYCNNGTATANNVYIEVDFGAYLWTPMSSTLPWSSQIGNIYRFDIGTIEPGECGSFRVTDSVFCEVSVGDVLCVKAHIYPDSLCEPIDGNWDQSSVSVEGSCVGDSLACFTIYNTGDPGNGDMTGTSEYRIFENNIWVDAGTFQIAGGDSLVICFLANGNTIRLEADQRPGHPGSSKPRNTIEGCGTDSLGNVVAGLSNSVPQDDAGDFVEIDCQTLRGSFDPNEKLVNPVGITPAKYISSSDFLEYQINFQNTGNDTAFRVVLRDTLSEYLDISTVENGVSSHSNTFRVYGQGILEWTFINILLPDSNVNEPESHGFVKFKVSQQPNNAKGTVITNSADIYFDFNVPVITEEISNTVYDTVLTPLVSVPKLYVNDVNIAVYPNPFNSTTTFEITELRQDEPVTIQLFNAIGMKVKEIGGISQEHYILSRDNLNNGIYIYQIRSGADVIGAGKLIIE